MCLNNKNQKIIKIKMRSSFINFLIYVIFFSIKDINSRKKHYGKCVFIEKNTGSKIINFYKYKNRDFSSINNSFSINLCNDTKFTEWINETIDYGIDSQIAYINKNSNYSIRLAGPFFKYRNSSWKNTLILNKEEGGEDIYIYKPQYGDFCDESQKFNYSTTIRFEHKNIDEEAVEIAEFPNISDCEPVLKINYNKEYAMDYLLLQKVLNDCYIFTGIIFILLGIFLCFFSMKFQAINKIIISLIFGQLIIFNINLIFIGNTTALKDYLFILIIFVGLVISAPFIYFSRKIEKLYNIILSFSSGYICGVLIYEIFFFNTNSILSRSILIDVLLIFTTFFIGLNLIIPRNSIYYPPFIGSYILIRGFSLFIYNITDKGGFGDLHLLIYLIKFREEDLVKEYFENDYKHFYVYLIFIGLLLIGSEVIIFLKNKTDRTLSYSDLEDDDSSTSTEQNIESFDNVTKLTEK